MSEQLNSVQVGYTRISKDYKRSVNLNVVDPVGQIFTMCPVYY